MVSPKQIVFFFFELKIELKMSSMLSSRLLLVLDSKGSQLLH